MGWIGLVSIHVIGWEFLNSIRSGWVEKILQPEVCTPLIGVTHLVYFKSLILCITCITRSSFFLWLCTLMQHACQHLITNHQPTDTCTTSIRILSVRSASFYPLLWSHSQVFSLTMELDATCMPTSHHKSPTQHMHTPN